MAIEERNAVISSATMEIEDHGSLSSFVHLSWSGAGQGFGGHVLGRSEVRGDHGAYCATWVLGILRAAGVTKWSDLPGKVVRIRHEWNKVHAIGHAIDDDKWFSADDEFERIRKARP